jgi:hypothetical protein
MAHARIPLLSSLQEGENKNAEHGNEGQMDQAPPHRLDSLQVISQELTVQRM